MKIVLLSTRFSTFAAPILVSLVAAQHEVCGVLLLTRRRRRQGSLSLLWSLIMDFGPGGFLGKAFEAVYYTLHQALRRSAVGRRFASRCLTVGEAASEHDVPVYTTKDIGGAQAYELLRALDPDLIVIASFSQILPRKVFDYPRLGAINIHPGLLPQNRGPTPMFWALFDDVRETGVATHSIEAGVDSGDILANETVSIAAHDTEKSLSEKLGTLAATMLPGVIGIMESGCAAGTTQHCTATRYYRRPTPRQRRTLKKILQDRARSAKGSQG